MNNEIILFLKLRYGNVYDLNIEDLPRPVIVMAYRKWALKYLEPINNVTDKDIISVTNWYTYFFTSAKMNEFKELLWDALIKYHLENERLKNG